MSDWKSERERALCDAKCLVVKIGSAVLTDSQGLRADVLHSLAAQLAQIQRMGGGERKILVVSSAAVAAGRAVLAENGVKADTAGLAARQGAAAIGQGRLMRAWDDAFHCQNLPTAQVLLTQGAFTLLHVSDGSSGLRALIYTIVMVILYIISFMIQQNWVFAPQKSE